MNQIFGERFRSARKKNGLSLQDLADKVGNISRQALHKYDKGEVVPSGEKLKQLSEILNVPIDYFFQEANYNLDRVFFRELNLTTREVDKIIEEVKDQLSRYLEIEEILGIKTSFIKPLTTIPKIKNQSDIDNAADTLRREWNLGFDAIPNCIELLECHNIKVIEVSVPDGFDGMQAWVNDIIPIIALNRGVIKSSDRIRFTVLHELAHLVLRFDDDIDDDTREKFCHQFAAALLLPREVIIKLLGETRNQVIIQELGEIKLQFGISIQAIVMRAKDLNIISEKFCKKFFWHFKQVGYKTVEPYPYEGKEQSHRFNQLVFRALGEELISENKAAVLKNQSFNEFQEKYINLA